MVPLHVCAWNVHVWWPLVGAKGEYCKYKHPLPVLLSDIRGFFGSIVQCLICAVENGIPFCKLNIKLDFIVKVKYTNPKVCKCEIILSVLKINCFNSPTVVCSHHITDCMI